MATSRSRRTIRVSLPTALMLLVLLLAATNPSHQDFVAFVFSDTPDGPIASNPYILRAADELVRRRDFGIASLYYVEVDPNQDLVWIGILGQFIPWLSKIAR